MSKKIKIKSAPGNPPSSTDGTEFLVDYDLYFEQTSTAGQFLLYAPSKATPPGPASVIPTNPTPLTTGTNFTFAWQGSSWSISNFQILITGSGSSEHGSASGTWTATPLAAPETMPSEEGGNPESGTFQANDTADMEGESSASAYA